MVSASAVYDRQPIRCPQGHENDYPYSPGEAQLPAHDEHASYIRRYAGREYNVQFFRCPMWVWSLYRRTNQDEFHEIMSDPEERACAEALWRLR